MSHTHLINNTRIKEYLKDLQIYHLDDNISVEECCFLRPIEGQIESDIIKELEGIINTKFLKLRAVKNIAVTNNLYLIIHSLEGNSRTRIFKYGNEDSPNKAHICLVDSHFFKYKESPFSRYFIDNGEELENVADGNNIDSCKVVNGKKYYSRKPNVYKMNSYEIVSHFIRNKNKFLDF